MSLPAHHPPERPEGIEVEALLRVVAARDALERVLWADPNLDPLVALDAAVVLVHRARLLMGLAAETRP